MNLFVDYEYLALHTASYSEAGWDRNDPPSTQYYQTYTGFKDEAAMIAWVKQKETSSYGDKNYVIVKCTKMDVTVEVKIHSKVTNG